MGDERRSIARSKARIHYGADRRSAFEGKPDMAETGQGREWPKTNEIKKAITLQKVPPSPAGLSWEFKPEGSFRQI
jgi:hypothetical protein